MDAEKKYPKWQEGIREKQQGRLRHRALRMYSALSNAGIDDLPGEGVADTSLDSYWVYNSADERYPVKLVWHGYVFMMRENELDEDGVPEWFVQGHLPGDPSQYTSTEIHLGKVAGNYGSYAALLVADAIDEIEERLERYTARADIPSADDVLRYWTRKAEHIAERSADNSAADSGTLDEDKPRLDPDSPYKYGA